MVLLDEATSAVDTETEQKIQEALRTLCEGRTTFIVAYVYPWLKVSGGR
jgi:ABC-type multidrug transport system fused ATPase/permease subunit